ncbi:Aste57867_13873 [Aphanomyces stellatus]|uniref:RING-type E3 ubiquitin transferase n=1 Tax=Aphanomyces stellatus TaxID=120398 RepID=A0A485KZ77_9STRA|nr:hypothetical protein As57867_013822 [Aphanomyces stellatus]VFT90704.1 Aste57867_13873 [Aphanomyces stellatus]
MPDRRAQADRLTPAVGKSSTANTHMESPFEEEECRVCRGEEEPHRRLFAPCKCSGSIRYVHSDCLMEWLAISKRDTCDLCSHAFTFRQVYADGCPEVLPLHEFLASAAALAFREAREYMRIGVVLVAWFVVAPWCISWFYRLWFLRTPAMDTVRFFDRMEHMDTVADDLFSGLVLMLGIVFTSLYLVCIAEDVQIEANQIHRDMLVAHGWDGADDFADEGEPEGESDDEDQGGADAPVADAAGGGPHRPRRLRVREDDNLPLVEQVLHHAPRHQRRRHDHHADEQHDQPHPGDDDEWIFEIMGFRGPVTLAMRNVALFLAFAAAFLIFFGFVPHAIGTFLLPHTVVVVDALPNTIYDALRHASDAARARGDCLQFEDLCVCVLGYSTWCAALVAWRVVGPALSHGEVLPPFVWGITCLGAAMKLSTLLFLKVFVLPFVVGVAIDGATLPLFQRDVAARVVDVASHMLLSSVVHWVVGMGFIHLISVTTLQMREVLHPDILTNVLPPHDPHQYKFRVILAQHSVEHVAALATTTLKYLVFVPVLVYAPLALASSSSSLFPLDLTFSYVAPLLQVPFELALAHNTIQDTLDHYAYSLGTLHTIWTTAVCRRLGLVEYLLPRVPAVVAGSVASTHGEVILAIPRLVFDPIDDHRPVHEHHHDERLVYGDRRVEWPKDANPAKLEYNLLPRRTPPFVALRVAALVVCWWLSMTSAVAALTLGPLAFGRCATALLDHYWGFRHDSLNVAVGLFSLNVLVFGVQVCRVLAVPDSDVHPQLRLQGYHLRHMTRAAFARAALLWTLVSPAILGTMGGMLMPAAAWPTPFEVVGFGFLVLHLATFVATLTHWDYASLPESLCVVLEQLQFHVDAHNDGVDDNVDVSAKCFDLAQCDAAVLRPLGIVLVVGLAVPTLCARLVPGVGHLTDVHVFRAAFATELLGALAVITRTHVTRALTTLHDAIRDERYLIGRELTDMVAPPAKHC